MKLIHPLAWLFFLGVFSFDVYQYIDLSLVQQIPGSLFGLPFQPAPAATALLMEWSHLTTRDGNTVLHEVTLNTQWDFLFIVGYVSVLIMLSYNQMQKEARPWLNNLLRLNFPIAILAGLMDAIENGILLADMAPYNVGNCYYSSYYFSLLKFIFGGWALLIWLLSLLSARSQR